jgi:alanine dehydrogenase
MRIGVPKEVKSGEYRVGLTPTSARELISAGHEVWVQRQAGAKIGFDDAQYEQVGAILCDAPEEIFQKAELIIKVKEPQPQECKLLRPNQVLFTYLHLAANRSATVALNNATFPYVLVLANLGYKKALTESAYFMQGLNVYQGKITYRAVAEAFGETYVDPTTLLY